MDEARPADAIVIFGAAEYNGTPSPSSRLDWTTPWTWKIATWALILITTGGSGGDPHFTEGGVARDYLIQQGVAEAKILTRPRSDTTYESVKAVRGSHAASQRAHLHRGQRRLSPLPHQAAVSRHGNHRLRLTRSRWPIEDDPTLRTLYSLREIGRIPPPGTFWNEYVEIRIEGRGCRGREFPIRLEKNSGFPALKRGPVFPPATLGRPLHRTICHAISAGFDGFASGFFSRCSRLSRAKNRPAGLLFSVSSHALGFFPPPRAIKLLSIRLHRSAHPRPSLRSTSQD